MWGSTQESFGLQLLLLVEIHQITTPDPAKPPVRDIMLKLFGPGPGVSQARLTDIWARQAVATIRAILVESP